MCHILNDDIVVCLKFSGSSESFSLNRWQAAICECIQSMFQWWYPFVISTNTVSRLSNHPPNHPTTHHCLPQPAVRAPLAPWVCRVHSSSSSTRTWVCSWLAIPSTPSSPWTPRAAGRAIYSRRRWVFTLKRKLWPSSQLPVPGSISQMPMPGNRFVVN